MLHLLAVPTNAAVVEALADGPRSLMELRRAADVSSRSTLRARLHELSALGVVKSGRNATFPYALDYGLAGPGRELLAVARLLQGWLDECPVGPVSLGSDLAKGPIKALAEGWSSTVIRALAAKPLSLTELNRLIVSLSHPSLERRLGTMRQVGQIQPLPSSGPGTPYTVTDWLRRGTAPLAAAVRWERLNAAEETAPIGRLDIEAAFLLTIPLVRPPASLCGSCRLLVETSNGSRPRSAGVTVESGAGAIVSCVTSNEGEVDARASGSAAGWLEAVLERDFSRLEFDGDCQLAEALVDGLNRALCRSRPASCS